jgi:heme a synthase
MAELSPRRLRVFSIAAWATLAFSVLVILGGAIVRATGSGAGCGDSWPKCGDQFIPPNPTVETIIEFSHRVTSFLAGLGVLLVVILAFRFFEKGHIVRKAAVVSGIILIVEALLGAALVLYGWVDDDVSLGRVIVVPLHLTNTFLLLGSLTVTAWWGSGRRGPVRPWRSSSFAWVLGGAIVLIVLGATGALNALADTIFPSETVTGDLSDKFGPTAPTLSRLRIVHPIVAVIGGLFVAWLATSLSRTASSMTRAAAAGVTWIVLSQMFIGIANIFFLTPLILQVVHLMVADLLWIVYVVFGASLMGDPARVDSRPAVAA